MLELKNVSFEVEGLDDTRPIVRDVSIKMEDEKLIAITGPNGGGKSTLAKLIMGMEKPTQGRIYLNGEDITDLDVTKRARGGLSFAFQQPVRFKGLIVKDLIELAAGKPLALREACAYLAEVGLCAQEYALRELDASLSGGELKRVEIAMAIARNSPLSIFDEPEAGIDLWSFHNLIRVFEKLREKVKGTIIIISHQERILEIADEIIVLAQGEVSAAGRREDILPELLSQSRACAYYKRSRARAGRLARGFGGELC